MKVSLIDYTGCGHPDPNHAVNILLFTKSTRLEMSPDLLEEIARWPWNTKKLPELNYMANTIPSSWEFVDYTFMIEGVTRAFTHQFVRTRTASYAQQTMRVLDVSEGHGWDYLTGPSLQPPKSGEEFTDDHAQALSAWQSTMNAISQCYKFMIQRGVKIEDARGILPTNILTNIAVKMNMRTFVELSRKRASPRTQGEYRDVLEAMKEQVRAVHPWIGIFIDRDFDVAAKELCDELRELEAYDVPEDKRTALIKLVDQMRAQS